MKYSAKPCMYKLQTFSVYLNVHMKNLITVIWIQMKKKYNWNFSTV